MGVNAAQLLPPDRLRMCKPAGKTLLLLLVFLELDSRTRSPLLWLTEAPSLLFPIFHPSDSDLVNTMSVLHLRHDGPSFR
ncbi:hypothetical protein OJAV_G00184380 [Oryzias javanicus]|uniref:Uncharacterized protein n=1 Tax=Oryzias javanicus TaxID=123683 RepID=A0A3S2MJH3_ORYJA|nr:hypothetical protein OJAV_G00184380 [Oryzias javanicus]